MPNGKKTPNSKSETKSKGAQIDVIFAGPLLFVPTAEEDTVSGIEVYSPDNGHPIGALFLPEVWFSDTELDDPKCERWPEPESFSLLDPHSYTIEIAQSGTRIGKFAVGSIPAANHKIKAGRKLSHHWQVAIAVTGRLSNWTSHRLINVTPGMFAGSDRPLEGSSVSSLQRLSYQGAAGVEFCGLSPEPAEYLRTNGTKGGTLIVIGEIPYQSSLKHERQAIDAIAQLAGLDWHLIATAPTTGAGRLMNHIAYCLSSAVLLPSK